MYSSEDATVTKGCINRVLTESGVGRTLLQTDIQISGGNSGGPIVDTAGNVLGVATFRSIVTDNLTYAVSIDEVTPMLKMHDIDFMYIGGFEYWYIIIAVLVIAAAAVAIIIINGKGKKQTAPIIEQKRHYVVVNSPRYGGMRSEVSATPIMIGRKMGCGLVFPSDAPGVSSEHCLLSFNAERNCFVLIDNSSTYGTFLMNGQKLVPGMQSCLFSGDCFYLGGREITLTVISE